MAKSKLISTVITECENNSDSYTWSKPRNIPLKSYDSGMTVPLCGCRAMCDGDAKCNPKKHKEHANLKILNECYLYTKE